MYEEMTEILRERFGPDGVRRFPMEQTTALGLPPAEAEALAQLGVPVRSGVYFTAADPGDPVALGEFARARGRQIAPEQANWVRMGTDLGAELCVAPNWSVWAVDVFGYLPTRRVNATYGGFLSSLVLLDIHLTLFADPGEQPMVEIYKNLRAGLVKSDRRALDDDDDWWPLVMEDVRHSNNFPGYASAGFPDRTGQKQTVTARGDAATGYHAEERLPGLVEQAGVSRDAVTEVYTELKLCLMPGHYCALRLGALFPQATFTHSFDYGDTAASRQQAIVEAMRHAAETKTQK
ncbi:MAG TPA: nucleic acid/nucleotide deaminase domain-containing protein [Actinocrinis sp.]|nr:nucleic acid/nucleotide deaminase domain-containing protein [Actinocrinis sp.]